MYKHGAPIKQKFSVSVPRSSYIFTAFSTFSKNIAKGSAELMYKETNSRRTITNVLDDGYKIGIVRYAEGYDKYFREMFEEKDLVYEVVSEFSQLLAVSKNSKLAKEENVTFDMLASYTEIVHADPYVTSIPLSQLAKEELSSEVERKILVFERASRLELLSENPDTFMWVCSVTEKERERYGLSVLKCTENKKMYKDVLIYKKGYKLSELDNDFITELCLSKRKYISKT